MAHGAPSSPTPPPDPAEGHEKTDVAMKPILIFLIGLVVFGGLVQLSMRALMQGYIAQDTHTAIPSADELRDHGNLTRIAPLQRDTTGDMVNMYKEEDQILTLSHVDAKTKKVRIPLDRAIDIVVKKGLPHRDVAPDQLKPGMDNVPRAGRAYQTTLD